MSAPSGSHLDPTSLPFMPSSVLAGALHPGSGSQPPLSTSPSPQPPAFDMAYGSAPLPQRFASPSQPYGQQGDGYDRYAGYEGYGTPGGPPAFALPRPPHRPQPTMHRPQPSLALGTYPTPMAIAIPSLPPFTFRPAAQFTMDPGPSLWSTPVSFSQRIPGTYPHVRPGPFTPPSLHMQAPSVDAGFATPPWSKRAGSLDDRRDKKARAAGVSAGGPPKAVLGGPGGRTYDEIKDGGHERELGPPTPARLALSPSLTRGNVSRTSSPLADEAKWKGNPVNVRLPPASYSPPDSPELPSTTVGNEGADAHADASAFEHDVEHEPGRPRREAFPWPQRVVRMSATGIPLPVSPIMSRKTGRGALPDTDEVAGDSQGAGTDDAVDNGKVLWKGKEVVVAVPTPDGWDILISQMPPKAIQDPATDSDDEVEATDTSNDSDASPQLDDREALAAETNGVAPESVECAHAAVPPSPQQAAANAVNAPAKLPIDVTKPDRAPVPAPTRDGAPSSPVRRTLSGLSSNLFLKRSLGGLMGDTKRARPGLAPDVFAPPSEAPTEQSHDLAKHAHKRRPSSPAPDNSANPRKATALELEQHRYTPSEPQDLLHIAASADSPSTSVTPPAADVLAETDSDLVNVPLKSLAPATPADDKPAKRRRSIEQSPAKSPSKLQVGTTPERRSNRFAQGALQGQLQGFLLPDAVAFRPKLWEASQGTAGVTEDEGERGDDIEQVEAALNTLADSSNLNTPARAGKAVFAATLPPYTSRANDGHSRPDRPTQASVFTPEKAPLRSKRLEPTASVFVPRRALDTPDRWPSTIGRRPRSVRSEQPSPSPLSHVRNLSTASNTSLRADADVFCPRSALGLFTFTHTLRPTAPAFTPGSHATPARATASPPPAMPARTKKQRTAHILDSPGSLIHFGQRVPASQHAPSASVSVSEVSQFLENSAGAADTSATTEIDAIEDALVEDKADVDGVTEFAQHGVSLALPRRDLASPREHRTQRNSTASPPEDNSLRTDDRGSPRSRCSTAARAPQNSHLARALTDLAAASPQPDLESASSVTIYPSQPIISRHTSVNAVSPVQQLETQLLRAGTQSIGRDDDGNDERETYGNHEHHNFDERDEQAKHDHAAMVQDVLVFPKLTPEHDLPDVAHSAHTRFESSEHEPSANGLGNAHKGTMVPVPPRLNADTFGYDAYARNVFDAAPVPQSGSPMFQVSPLPGTGIALAPSPSPPASAEPSPSPAAVGAKFRQWTFPLSPDIRPAQRRSSLPDEQHEELAVPALSSPSRSEPATRDAWSAMLDDATEPSPQPSYSSVDDDGFYPPHPVLRLSPPGSERGVASTRDCGRSRYATANDADYAYSHLGAPAGISRGSSVEFPMRPRVLAVVNSDSGVNLSLNEEDNEDELDDADSDSDNNDERGGVGDIHFSPTNALGFRPTVSAADARAPLSAPPRLGPSSEPARRLARRHASQRASTSSLATTAAAWPRAETEALHETMRALEQAIARLQDDGAERRASALSVLDTEGLERTVQIAVQAALAQAQAELARPQDYLLERVTSILESHTGLLQAIHQVCTAPAAAPAATMVDASDGEQEMATANLFKALLTGQHAIMERFAELADADAHASLRAATSALAGAEAYMASSLREKEAALARLAEEQEAAARQRTAEIEAAAEAKAQMAQAAADARAAEAEHREADARDAADRAGRRVLELEAKTGALSSVLERERATRNTVGSEVEQLRAALAAAQGDKAEALAALRAEIGDEIAAVRAEMVLKNAALRAEKEAALALQAGKDVELDALRDEKERAFASAQEKDDVLRLARKEADDARQRFEAQRADLAAQVQCEAARADDMSRRADEADARARALGETAREGGQLEAALDKQRDEAARAAETLARLVRQADEARAEDLRRVERAEQERQTQAVLQETLVDRLAQLDLAVQASAVAGRDDARQQVDEWRAKHAELSTRLHALELESTRAAAAAQLAHGALEAELEAERAARAAAEQRAAAAEARAAQLERAVDDAARKLAQVEESREAWRVAATEREAWAKTAETRVAATNQETYFWRQFALDADRARLAAYLGTAPFHASAQAAPAKAKLGDAIGDAVAPGARDRRAGVRTEARRVEPAELEKQGWHVSA
ncbi:hypothetical protein Q5752_001021 [Cryptotrichosporon argae]